MTTEESEKKNWPGEKLGIFGMFQRGRDLRERSGWMS